MALALAALFLAAPADDPRTLLRDAQTAADAGDYRTAIAKAAAAAAVDPKDPVAPLFLGTLRLKLRQPAEAVAAFTRAVELAPGSAVVLDRRGDAHLKNGQFAEAVADFDAYLKAEPADAAHHWRRGIALYYAGRYADGVKQFDLHRTVNPQDVENSAWHYLCNAKANGPAKARADLLPVSRDARVPMAQVLDLFAGKSKPADVLAAAEGPGLTGDARKSARFYANLYVALWHESEGGAKAAKAHLTAAVEKYEVPDYMWDVAKAHLGAAGK